MSDQTPTIPAEQPLTFAVEEFQDGAAKGFKYTVPNFNTIEKAVELYGESRVLGLLNGQILARIRTKVKNDLGLSDMKPLEVGPFLQKKLAATNGILFTEADANEWRPDVRELSPGGMVKKITELLQSGKQADAVALAAKLQRVMAELCESEIKAAQASEATPATAAA